MIYVLNTLMITLTSTATAGRALKRGVREVVKCITKGTKGYFFHGNSSRLCYMLIPNPRVCIIAGDISPIDVISHIPMLCEENDIPYVFTPSKAELGAAAGTKRPTSVVLVTAGAADADHREKYDKLFPEVRALEPVF